MAGDPRYGSGPASQDLKDFVMLLTEWAHSGAGIETLRIDMLNHVGKGKDVIVSRLKEVIPSFRYPY
jgi:hypothetical protein